MTENATTPASGSVLKNMCASQQLVCCQMFSPGHIARAATSLLAHNIAVGGSFLVITALVVYFGSLVVKQGMLAAVLSSADMHKSIVLCCSLLAFFPSAAFDSYSLLIIMNL